MIIDQFNLFLRIVPNGIYLVYHKCEATKIEAFGEKNLILENISRVCSQRWKKGSTGNQVYSNLRGIYSKISFPKFRTS